MSLPNEIIIVQKSWTTLSDQVIFKDVATKGKHIHLALMFISKRSKKSLSDTTDLFQKEINEYCERLLKNRQIFKAEHVLKNCNRNPKYFFYEYLYQNSQHPSLTVADNNNEKNSGTSSPTQSSSSASSGYPTASAVSKNDDDNKNPNDELMELIENYLKKSYANYENEKSEMNAILRMIQILKVNPLVFKELFLKNKNIKQQQQYSKLNLETFYEYPMEIRQWFSVTIFFKHTEFSLINLLNKFIIWKYLFDEKLYSFVLKWLDILYDENKTKQFKEIIETDISDVITIMDHQKHMDDNAICNVNTKATAIIEKTDDNHNQFKCKLYTYFKTQQIDNEMIEFLNLNHTKMNNDIIRNALAKNSIYLCDELNDNNCRSKIVQRIFVTQSVNQNDNKLFVYSTETIIIIIKKLLNENFPKKYLTLLFQEFISDRCLEALQCKNNGVKVHQNEIDLCATLKKLNINDNLIEISTLISMYFINNGDFNFYANNQLVFMFELLTTGTNQLLQQSQQQQPLNVINSIIENCKFTIVNGLFKKLLNRCGSLTADHKNDYEIKLYDLIQQYKNIDLNKLLTDCNDSNNKYQSLSFTNLMLTTKYAEPTKLTYLNYIKQYRSSYAIYIFLMEQLQHYSQISQCSPQILRSANVVAEMAVKNWQNKELVIHCIAFIEMLNINTSTLRALLKCIRIIHTESMNSIESLSDYEFIEKLKNILCIKLNDQIASASNNNNSDSGIITINLREFEAFQLLYKSHQKHSSMSNEFLLIFAKQYKWFLFILFATYFNYLPGDVIKICQMAFNRSKTEKDEDDHDGDDRKLINNNINIGRNIAMALKFDHFQQQMLYSNPLRNGQQRQQKAQQKLKRHSFSFREHKRQQIQNKIEMISSTASDTFSPSISSNETITNPKINPSQLLYSDTGNIDLFATLLLLTNRNDNKNINQNIRNSPTSTAASATVNPSVSISTPASIMQLNTLSSELDFVKFKNLLDQYNVPLNQEYTNRKGIERDNMNLNFSQDSSSSTVELLKCSFQRKWPILSVFAAELNNNNNKIHIDYCWLAWLITSIDEYINVSDISDVSSTPPHQKSEIKNISNLSKIVIERCITGGYIKTLHQSIKIFYPKNSFHLFTEYLLQTKKLQFTMKTTELLQKYLISVNNRNINNNIDQNETDNFQLMNIERMQLLTLSSDLLLLHLKYNFPSVQHKQYLLQSLCDSGISDFNQSIDFSTIKSICTLISFTNIQLNIDVFTRHTSYSDNEIKMEYNLIMEQLINLREFQIAMDISDLLQYSKDNLIYERWCYQYELQQNEFDLKQCEFDCGKYHLSPELMIHFYRHIAKKLVYTNHRKYEILKCILDAIKKHHLFPNESFDRDRIEYEMILSFIKNSTNNLQTLDIYHSEYYECIMSNERGVLYKTFLELKEMAGVDELSIYNRQELNELELEKLESIINCQLDAGDIVQALRIQAIFNYRPIDLHFLVFAMALAEGLTNIYDLTYEQRQMLNDGNYKYAKFNKRTLQQQQQQQTTINNNNNNNTQSTVNNPTSSSSSASSSSATSSSPTTTTTVTLTTTTSPNKKLPSTAVIQNNNHYLSDISGDFEEIPSREKQDILDAIQAFASRLKHGIKLGQRIAMATRIAMYLDKEYVDVLKTKDPNILLQNAISDDCFNKLIVMSDIMISMEMTSNEIAKFFGEQIASTIIKSKFYLLRMSSVGGNGTSNNNNNNNAQSTTLNPQQQQQSLANSTLTSLLNSVTMSSSINNAPVSQQIQMNKLWGYNLDTDFHLFLELCSSSTSQLGYWLLKYCDGLKLYRKIDGHHSNQTNNTNKDPAKNTSDGSDTISLKPISLNMENNTNNNNNEDNSAINVDAQMKEIILNLRDIMQMQILSHKKQNTITVELLIKAHECFVHECSMEGIANVLQRTKQLNTVLANAKSWNLIVRMLMGIGRYRDMYYCFETLIKNDQFESLLGQFDNNEQTTIGLQQAIISYLQENCTENNENYRLAALHFRMYKEIAEMWENEAKSQIAKLLSDNELYLTDDQCNSFSSTMNVVVSPVSTTTSSGASTAMGGGTTSSSTPLKIPFIKCSDSVQNILDNIMNGYAHSAENYLLDNKLCLAQRAAYHAELIALQIQLNSRTMIERNLSISISVLNVRSANVFRYFINNSLSVSHALILMRNYPYEIVWTETILHQYILNGNEQYLLDYCLRMDLTDDMIETIVKNFQHNLKVTNQMEYNLSNLIERIESVTLRYKMASLLGLKGILANLINDVSLYYLKDTNYGKLEI